MDFDLQNIYQEMLLEFSDAAIRKIAAKFSNDASEEDVRRELADFEKYKAKIEKKDPFQYKTWIELTEVIHAAKAASEQKKNFKKADVEGVANTDDIVADDENVTIYRGDSQDKCVLYGRGYTFCISRPAGGNMFSNYRLGKESTFYFIFFKKKSPEENDHIMVLDHTNNGYEWTFKDNNTQRVEGGWDEIVVNYPELARYEDLLSNKKLTEEEKVFSERLEKFSRQPSLQKFKEFTYKEQSQALKAIVNLPDEIWNVLDSTLRNEFISIGPNLTEYQADDLKPNEVARYKKTRALSFQQLVKSGFLEINKYDDINQIASSPNIAYKYAKDVLKGQNVPDIIIKGIASSAQYAYMYADYVLEGENVPDIIINGIASDAEYAYNYAKDVLEGENVPDIIIKRIASDAESAYRYAKFILKGQNVPDIIIRGIASDAEYAYMYAKFILKGQNVPDIIIRGIASDAEYAYMYAKNILNWQNVPDIIIKRIASDAESAYRYAINIPEGQNVPDIIIGGIASDTKYAYRYAQSVLEGQNVPDEIIKSIASKPLLACKYARDFLHNQNIPSEIIKSIASDARWAYIYAKDVLKWQNVPDEIMKSIASDLVSAYFYAKDDLRWKNVPKEIIKTLQDAGEEIPPETTIKENTDRILINFDQLFERVCFLKDL
jgi:hypothetical protein